MAQRQKFYVVWRGRVPGVYGTWVECKAQVEGFAQARYKSFETAAEAEAAWLAGPPAVVPRRTATARPTVQQGATSPLRDSICVDAACSGANGPVEYRCVHTATGQQLFHRGPFAGGTNNVGEFLAIVHGLAYLQQHQLNLPLYTDSHTAMVWVRQKKAKTTLQRSARNAELFGLVERAEQWLRTHTYSTPILKWDTEHWGEIPADFGRK